MEEERPNPDLLLKQIQTEEAEAARKIGKLKIFFGYAAGVGKTYAMLEAAHAAKTEGIDVVAGYIEPHTRPETLALLLGEFATSTCCTSGNHPAGIRLGCDIKTKAAACIGR